VCVTSSAIWFPSSASSGVGGTVFAAA
jgi:hypothetical protein